MLVLEIEWINPTNKLSFYDTIMADLNVNYSLNLFTTLIHGIFSLFFA